MQLFLFHFSFCFFSILLL